MKHLQWQELSHLRTREVGEVLEQAVRRMVRYSSAVAHSSPTTPTTATTPTTPTADGSSPPPSRPS